MRPCKSALRFFSFAATIAFVWTFILSAPVTAAASGIIEWSHSRAEKKRLDALRRSRLAAASGHRASPLGFVDNVHTAHLAPVPPRRASVNLTLLDEVGRMVQPVAPGEPARWRAELRQARGEQAALLHVRLGEVALAQEDEPEKAIAEFLTAERVASKRQPVYGLAAYDCAIARFYEGDYRTAQEDFRSLLLPKTAFSGYERTTCALWYRHAGACAGYHAQRNRAGIPEPTRVDPLCAAAAMGVWLKRHGMPYSRKQVLANLQVTGRGSNVNDIEAAARKLGLVAHTVSSDETGLLSLPMPLIAHVEHDHFIAVVRADRNGVRYLCSDCGPWPGGEVALTWKQWRMLEADAYVAITRKGSDEDRALAALPTKRTLPADGVKLAMAGGIPGGQATSRLAMLTKLLAGHVIAIEAFPVPIGCGVQPNAQHCGPQSCPMDSNCHGEKGASEGDPVNLATLEEEYAPAPDLTVYNPTGPAVTWQRVYNHLRGTNNGDNRYGTMEDDDFGPGWSTPYNVAVYDPTAVSNPAVSQGNSSYITPNGTQAPASGLTWDILSNSGGTVATSTVTNSWTVSYSTTLSKLSVSAPMSAAAGINYLVRYHYSSTVNYSALFDVVVPANFTPVNQGATLTINSMGSLTGSGPAGYWWVTTPPGIGGVTVATSTAPVGWNVSSSVAFKGSIQFNIVVPANAAAGDYEAYLYLPGETGPTYTYWYVKFSVVAARWQAQAGTKWVDEVNGARFSFTAPTVPTASLPRVQCTVQAGYPALVEWDYTSADPSGYYTITWPDRSKWITTTWCAAVNSTGTAAQLYFEPAQITDRAGNYDTFTYASVGQSKIPLLSSINDSSGNPLLTIARKSDGSGNVAYVSDRYGRSVYYASAAFTGTAVPAYLVTQVSEIVATGTLSPPARYTLGYQTLSSNYYNSEGTSTTFLHTISVPSPTGTGAATATINYNSTTDLISSIVDANGNKRSYTIVSGNTTQVTITNAASSTVTGYTSTFDTNMSETSRTDGTNSTIVYSATFADPNDPYRPSQVQDGNGYAVGGAGGKGTWSYTWDQFGNLQTETTPRGTETVNTWSYTNFALGELTQVQTTGKQATTVSYYEPSGLVNTVTYPQPGTVNGTASVSAVYTWDTMGNLVTVKTPGNNATVSGGTDHGITTSYGYTTDGTYSQSEALGQPITVTNNLGNVTHVRYNQSGYNTGLTSSVTDALGNQSTAAYNIANQTTQATFPATGQTGSGQSYVTATYQYPGGPVSSEQAYDESGAQIRQITGTYGYEGELLGLAGSTEPVTVTYDGAYRTSTVTDGNSHTTSYGYSTAGYENSVSYPRASGSYDTTTFSSFDNDGNPLTRVDGNGLSTTLTYNNPESRLTAVTYPTGWTGLNIGVTYDSYGRTGTVSDGTGSRTYSYDDLNELTENNTSYTGPGSQPINYAYYNDGQRETMSTPAGSFSYTYDAIGRPTGLSDPASVSYGWSYLNNNWLNAQTSGTALTTSLTYNALGRITELANTKTSGGSTLSQFGAAIGSGSELFYDGVGNLKKLTASIPSTTYGGTTNYTLDSRDEMTQESTTRYGGATNNFSFDTAGNFLTFKGADPTGGAGYNSDNQNSSTSYVWDGNGNPTTWRGTSITFDPESRATAIGTALTNGYRADGLRAWKQNSSTKTWFLYDGAAPVCEMNSSGTVTATNTFGPTGLLARNSGGSSVLYAFDAAGNTVERLSTSGTVLNQTYTDAFGATTGAASGDPYGGFGAQAGYYTDSETGLTLCGHRFYDAGVGRWLNRDPIGYGGGVNLYGYCSNNPVLSDDPSGLLPPSCHGDPDSCVNWPKPSGPTFGKGWPGLVPLPLIGIGIIGGETGAAGGEAGAVGGAVGGIGIITGSGKPSRAGYNSNKNPDGKETHYPPNDGFKWNTPTLMQPGQTLWRYGSPNGTFVTDPGTDPWKLSLPWDNPGWEDGPSGWMVAKPFIALKGPASPWFAQPGGGTQYKLPSSCAKLESGGFLVPIIKNW